MVGFVDSDYAENLDIKKSLIGFIFSLYGTVITWKASLQYVVALSTIEAEYITLNDDVNEAMWLRGSLTELGIKQESASVHSESKCEPSHKTSSTS